MRYQDVCEGVRAGTILLDACGHRVNDTKERLLCRYDNAVSGAKGKNDGTWTKRDEKPMEEIDANMRDYYQKHLDADVEDNFAFGYMSDGEYCFYCGRRMQWRLEGNTLVLKQYFEDGYNLIDHCDWEPKPNTGIITINSKLVFTNFFDLPDCEDEDKYGFEYDLECNRGLHNITKYKENQNIAYGQMGNMSVGIYVHPNKESIIIGDPYIADTLIDERFGDVDLSTEQYDDLVKKLSDIEGHKLVGTISLGVWRWEAGDKDMLGEHYTKVVEDPYMDVVEVDTHQGQWRFTHYYCCGKSPSEYIYARMELVK